MRKVNMLLFSCICLTAYGQKNSSGDTVMIDEVKIPISACVEANSKILGNSVEPVAFCKCLIPKFYQYFKNDPEKLNLLKGGNWYKLAKDKQEIVGKYFQDCMTQSATNDSTAKLTITPRMAVGMKTKMKEDLIGSDIEKTNDIDKYCDCIIDTLQVEFTIKEIMQENFNQTDKYQRMLEKCLTLTKKK